MEITPERDTLSRKNCRKTRDNCVRVLFALLPLELKALEFRSEIRMAQRGKQGFLKHLGESSPGVAL